MRRALFALCIMLLCAPACFADLYWQSPFNSDAVGAPTPAMWTQVNAPPPSIVDATTPDVVTYGVPDETIRCVRFYENPAVDASLTAPRQSIYRGFPWQIAGPAESGGTGGTVVLEFDVRFPSQSEHNEGFLIRLCGHDGTSSDPTNGRTWGVGMQFVGDTSYDATGSPYSLQIQTQRFAQLYSQLRDSSGTAITYGADTWYSVKIEADMVLQKCRFWFAPKGGTLVNVTSTLSNPDGWRDWIPSNGTGGVGTKVANLHNAMFSLTRQKAAEGRAGKVFLDNVRLTIPQDAVVASSLSDLRLADNGSLVQASDAVVTCAQGIVGPAIYVQENRSGGAGVRVRTDGSTIVRPDGGDLALGDKVAVKGYLRQVSDNGLTTAHVGERELVATAITVSSSDNAVPTPVTLTNKNVGGGWLGANETVSPGPEPRLKGVWPSNTTGDQFYYGNESANSFAPLFNVGTLVSVTGKVVKRLASYEANPTNLYPYDMYISDGSLADDGWRDSLRGVTDTSHPEGIRIRMSKEVSDMLEGWYGDFTGQYVTVVGISCATSGTDLTPSTNGGIARNIRGVRLRAFSDVTFIWN